MHASTLSAVASVGDRPRRRFRTNDGSPIASRPSSVGLVPVASRKVSTLARNDLLYELIGSMKRE